MKAASSDDLRGGPIEVTCNLRIDTKALGLMPET